MIYKFLNVRYINISFGYYFFFDYFFLFFFLYSGFKHVSDSTERYNGTCPAWQQVNFENRHCKQTGKKIIKWHGDNHMRNQGLLSETTESDHPFGKEGNWL